MLSAFRKNRLHPLPLGGVNYRRMVARDVPLVGFAFVGLTHSVAVLISFLQNNIALVHHISKYTGDLRVIIEQLQAYEGVDVVFGGPPCQGFSVAGKMDPNDERSQLIWRYLDVIETVRPKLFVMENVKALGCLEKWAPIREAYLKRTSELGYSCKLRFHLQTKRIDTIIGSF